MRGAYKTTKMLGSSRRKTKRHWHVSVCPMEQEVMLPPLAIGTNTEVVDPVSRFERVSGLRV